MNLRNDFLKMRRECLLLANGASPEVQAVLQGMAADFGKNAVGLNQKGIPALKVILITLAVLAVYFPTAYWLKISYTPVGMTPKVEGRIIPLHQPFAKFSELSVVVPDYWFGSLADSDSDDCRSPIVIYENDMPLGPPHSSRGDIATKGGGHFLHWRSSDEPMVYNGTAGFVFSPSDNTDPRTNGRRYWAVKPDAAERTNCPQKAFVHAAETEPMPDGKLIIKLHRPFETFGESHMAVAHDLNALAEFADYPNSENKSPVVLYEDDHPLGPAHSRHGDIATFGGGRYSHWKAQGMVFSTSDNSDPNTNGRGYWAVVPK